jgi:hypothetical protein
MRIRRTRYEVRMPSANPSLRRRVTPTPRTGRLRALVAAAAIALAACTGTEPETPIGDYTLSQVDGKSVPVALFAEPEYQVTVRAGTLALSADGKYVAAVTTDETVDGFKSTYVDSTSGTWAESAGTLVFTDALDKTEQTATFASPQLTMTMPSVMGTSTLVFAKK